MGEIINIIAKVLVREFYRSHLTFFLVVGGVVGGFMRSEDHLALAEIIVSSPLFLGIPVICWALYAVIVSRFNAQHMSLSQQEFLFSLLLVKPTRQYLVLLFVVLSELAPIVLYSILLFYISWREGEGLAALLLSITLVSIVILVVARLRSTLFGKVHRGAFLQLRPFFYVTKPYFLFFIEWVSRREFSLVVFTKLFTILLLLATAYVYASDVYDTRLLLMSVAAAGCVHGQLMWQMHKFDNYHMAFTRNLPIPIWQRYVNMLATSIVLLLPELGIILTNYSLHINFGATLLWCSLLVSILLLFYGLLFRKEKEQEQLISFIFFLCMGFIVLVLYKVPAIVLISCNMAMGLYFLYKRYYLFEYSTGKKTRHLDS